MTKIEKVDLFLTSMKLVQPFRTHQETVTDRESILVKVTDDKGDSGWGEVVAFSSPWYTEETIETTWHMLTEFFIPTIIRGEWKSPREVSEALSHWKRNQMAKAGIEMAMWDLFAKRKSVSLAEYIGGVRKEVKAGVVVSMDSPERMLSTIESRIKEGYERIKVKIDPANDYEMLKIIRDAFPDIALLVDANSAYSLQDAEHLKKLDSLNLLMIEQPLAADDIVEHTELQKVLSTPVCLDESIVSLHDARNAVKLGSCKVMSIKIGRVGGLANAIDIHDLCEEHDIPVWCGGMLETGISRAFHIALASLPNFTIPGDLSASSRYWEKDVIIPEVVVEDGKVKVPEGPGIGFEVDEPFIEQITKRKATFHAKTKDH
ncbi:o-succinylbenzoate synthase [Sutcliffiella horikoshii]|uniref:o-succinylbenzoate synthase n=1 Tax=Sutcliffiella horikoshii TaxID=79883 RepID=A0A5D4TAZ6_9BACI|nr:o-succinylbenzoate synthase [Sutcliffiella horikoshii]TYS71426.1 o-succinylbenzoate synthase [Sutcliffiella horikoshii]